MAEHREPVGKETTAEEPAPDVPRVNVREISGDRRVFTEDENCDGWIASDLTVSVRR